jgi:polysaccharide pyruvyl transferase WcaK-like protein
MGRSILIAGYYGFGNLGDEAILAALADGLRRHIDDVEICVGFFTTIGKSIQRQS